MNPGVSRSAIGDLGVFQRALSNDTTLDQKAHTGMNPIAFIDGFDALLRRADLKFRSGIYFCTSKHRISETPGFQSLPLEIWRLQAMPFRSSTKKIVSSIKIGLARRCVAPTNN